MPTTSSVQFPLAGDLDRIADANLKTPRQLFADQARVTGAKAAPGVCGRLKQRPAIPVGGVIGDTQNFNRCATDLRIGPPPGRSPPPRTLAQPRLDLGSLRIVSGAEIDVGREPSI